METKKPFTHYTSLKTSAVFKSLATSSVGLSNTTIQKRLSEFGENKITAHEVTAWDIFKRQFKSPFVYLLLAACILSFVLGEKVDAFMIALFVFINSSLGFYQEYRSEQTVKLLKKYLAKKIRVLRDGSEVDIDVALLVPGDLVVLEPGDIIPADIRFVEDYNLVVNETVLTGESVPVHKSSKSLVKPASDIYKADNIGFSGTTVVSGKAKGVVFATGAATNYAKIAKLAGETVKVSSFEKEISKFSKFTLWVVAATLIFIVVTSVAVKESPSITDLVLFSIALAVSVIPEALPVVTTFSLSIGAYNLTKKSVVVKRLTSVEDLGSLQVLASDKTGTLTQNVLKVEDVYASDKGETLLFANLGSYFTDNTRNAGNNAFDIALRDALTSEQKSAILDFKKLSEVPFDPERRRVTTLLSIKDRKVLVTRGSAEVVLTCVKSVKSRKQITKWLTKKGLEGKRSLAVAIKYVPGKLPKNLASFETDMQFLGLIAFTDPIKPSAFSAIKKAKEMGVAVKIITGDSPEVAGQVATQIKLTKNPKEVLTGSDFEHLSIEEKHEAVSKFAVFARITPEQKHQIISLLKEKYYTGFLGEGINDAPALKAANVAVVVESASDVAKEASDIVLLKKDLEVIIDGIGEGRRVFANTTKYITATMASNFGNFFAVAIIAPFIDFLPMLPLQILLVNLLSDFPMIMVATDTVDDEVVKTPKRYDLGGFATQALSFGFISTAFDFVVFSSFVSRGEASLQTYWFVESILSELLFLFTIRTTLPIWKAKLPSKPLIFLTIATIAATLILPFTSLGAKLFGFIRPSFIGLAGVFLIVFVYLVCNELAKFFIFRKK